ncbi:MAG TPA: glycosyltransferase family 39 protein [Micromonosporaceae bacterium]
MPGRDRRLAWGWLSWARWWRREAPFAAILLLAATLLTLNVGTPFWAQHEFNGAVFTGVAANHLRLGLGVTRGQDYFADTPYGLWPTPAQVPDLMALYFHGQTTAVPYGHHPPLLGLTVAGAIAVFGEHTAVVRAVPIVYSLLGLVLFYLLVVRLFDRGIARVASLLYATFPLFAYFGRNVCHEAPTLCYGLALILAYVRWRPGGPRRRWWAALMAGSVVVGGCYGWPMYYLVGLLIAVDWVSRRRFDSRLALTIGLPGVVTLAGVLGQITAMPGGGLSQLLANGQLRTGDTDSSGATPMAWWHQLVRYYAEQNFGKIAVALVPFAVGFLVYRAYRERLSQRTMIVGLFGAWGLVHIVLWRDGAWVHTYWQFYLLPFVAIVLAWPAVALARRCLTRQWLRAAAFVVAGVGIYLLAQPQILAFYENTTVGVVGVRTLWQSLLFG